MLETGWAGEGDSVVEGLPGTDNALWWIPQDRIEERKKGVRSNRREEEKEREGRKEAEMDLQIESQGS